MNKKRPSRSPAKSRAASLKGWRTRERMKAARKPAPGDTIAIYHPWGTDIVHIIDDRTRPTIDLIPKVSWP